MMRLAWAADMNADKVLAAIAATGNDSYQRDRAIWGAVNDYDGPLPHYAEEHFEAARREGADDARLASHVDAAFAWVDEILPGSVVSLRRHADGVSVEIAISIGGAAYALSSDDECRTFDRDEAALAIVAMGAAMTRMLELSIATDGFSVQCVLERAAESEGEGPQP